MNRADNIVIVGGGSAGWMSASTMINRFPNRNITLIESPYIPKIGVGESTLAGLPAWLRSLDIDFADFMKFTDASFKLSIRFEDFHHIGDGGYHYPFGHPYLGNTQLPGANDWHLMKIKNPEIPVSDYVDSIFPQSVLLNNRRIADPQNGELESWRLDHDFALHFNAVKFAEWLSENYAKPRGVKHIEAKVTKINSDDSGITSLELDNGQIITADLFIDCTGFKSMLLGETLKEEYLSFADQLPVNRAWAVQMPYEDPREELENYTNCTALGNGWVWNAPLYSRIGTGYVYSDKFTTPEAALEEFKEHLRKVKGAHRITDDLVFNDVHFKAGIYKRTWVKNVVAIGLSGAFVEPLESNGLFFIHENLIMLSKFLDRGYVNGVDIDFYNAATRNHYQYFASFIKYHYALSQRRDTEFWKYMTETPVAPYLADAAPNALFMPEMMAKTTQQTYEVSVYSGFHCIATGMEWGPVDRNAVKYWEWHNPNTNYDFIAQSFAEKTRQSKQKWNKVLVNAPLHYDYLTERFYSEDK
jgi:tryptophan halogenase